MTDTELLDWLEEQAKKSRTGISFDYVPHRGYRFMRRHFIGDAGKSLRSAIEAAIRVSKGGPFAEEEK